MMCFEDLWNYWLLPLILVMLAVISLERVYSFLKAKITKTKTKNNINV